MMASRSSIGKCFEDASESGNLNISHRGLKKLPASVDEYDLADVQFVDMSRNRFNELPEEILSFVMLERLNCSRNFVKTVPDLYNLNSLSHINISQNQLQTLPIYLCHLPLKILKASHNRISSIPSEIGTLSRLQCLDLSCNELTNLPSTVGDLNSLRSLNIHRNNIVILPDELSKLKNLQNLDFSSNKIAVIPPAYRLMQSLIKLNLKNNPLTSPPAKTCVKGRVHLIKCLGVTAQQEEKRWTIPTETLLHRSPSLSTASTNSRNSRTEHEQITSTNKPCEDDTSRMDKKRIESRAETSGVLFENDDGNDDDERSLVNEMTNIMNDKLSLSSKLSSELGEEPRTVDRKDEAMHSPCRSPEEDKPTLPPKPIKFQAPEMNEKRVPQEKGKLTPQSHRTPVTTPTSNKTFPRSEELDRGGSLDRNSMHQMAGNWNTDANNIRYEKKSMEDKADDITTRQRHLLKSKEEVIQSKQRLESIKSKTLPLPYDSYEVPFDGLKKRTHAAKIKSKNFLDGASNYTMKRLHDSAKEEFVELEKLRTVIEEKLRIKLPDDLPASLSDGIVLCHFVNHLRKGTIHSIHVPSSGVPKLTMPKCQMNVDAFLDACRKLGVNKVDLCSPPDILEEKNPTNLCKTVHALLLALGMVLSSDTGAGGMPISPPR